LGANNAEMKSIYNNIIRFLFPRFQFVISIVRSKEEVIESLKQKITSGNLSIYNGVGGTGVFGGKYVDDVFIVHRKTMFAMNSFIPQIEIIVRSKSENECELAITGELLKDTRNFMIVMYLGLSVLIILFFRAAHMLYVQDGHMNYLYLFPVGLAFTVRLMPFVTLISERRYFKKWLSSIGSFNKTAGSKPIKS
jgi:hypothetical protein